MTKRKILLHSCCAPCSTAVIERLVEYYDITVFYYNPNIYPKLEYEKRKAEQIKFINEINKKYPEYNVSFLDCDYEMEKFYDAIRGLEREPEGGARCAVCFKVRLETTAKLAKERGFDLFGTTLTVSPHKDAELINSIGTALQNRYDVHFLRANFKKGDGYKRSIELSKELNLYRQNYCGCEYSLHSGNNISSAELNNFF